MNKRRLLKLADLLEADAKNKKGMKFDLSHVGLFDTEPGIDCGTTGCAMGLAAISGKFKRAGLSFRADGCRIHTTINGRKVDYDRAAMRVFDITDAQARFFFTPWSYPAGRREGAIGERYVAKRIRHFVAGKVAALPLDA